MSFQQPTEPKKSGGAIVVLTHHSLDFLRPLCKLLLGGNRNSNIEIPNHFHPQVWNLPDAEPSLEQDVVVTTFSKHQVYVELRALPILLLILRCSIAVAVLKLGEAKRPPEGIVIPQDQGCILHVWAVGEMIRHQDLLPHEMEDAFALLPGHVLVQPLSAFQMGCLS